MFGIMKVDPNKIDDVVQTLLFLKGNDWDVLDRLHKKGLTSDPATKSKPVPLTDGGLKRSKELFDELYLVSSDRP